MFEGAQFRTFSYNFTFRPESAQESKTIRRIIHVFKHQSLPGVQGANGRLYTFPNEWAIGFDGLIHDWMDIPLTCVCTGVEVDHTGGQGYVPTIDGASSAITMTVNFTETVPLTRDRYVREVSALSGANRTRVSMAGKGSENTPTGGSTGTPNDNDSTNTSDGPTVAT